MSLITPDKTRAPRSSQFFLVRFPKALLFNCRIQVMLFVLNSTFMLIVIVTILLQVVGLDKCGK